MRKLTVVLLTTVILVGPTATMASANPLMCRIMEKLGYEWVRECETSS